VTAKAPQIETDAVTVRNVAELIGADTDSERAIRWLIAPRAGGGARRRERSIARLRCRWEPP